MVAVSRRPSICLLGETSDTANDIRGLEPSLFERPGRREVVLEFPNPGEPLRRRFLEHLDLGLDDTQLETAARMTDGLSFAHLREVHIVAAQAAFRRAGDVEWRDLEEGINRVTDALQAVRARAGARKAGFAVRRRSLRAGEPGREERHSMA